MKQIVFIMFAIILSTSCKKEKDISEIINQDIEYTLDKYQKIVKQVPEDTALLPRNFENGEIGLVQPRDWTSGFYPGILWYLYEYTNDDFWKKQAQKETAKLKSQKDNTYTHDLGFMLFCSYGNGYKFTKDTSYANILMQGAKSLISRYDSTVGLIRSWDHGKWEYPVIIDNMMNLEYLFWASEYSGNPVYRNIAIIHADNTLKHHFRDDNSSYHVVDYDTLTGEVISKGTHQGAYDESAWARGQAWGLYGYTMMYRETKNEKYLEQAKNIADFILTHKNMPEDFIPYWDFNAPDIAEGKAERDQSAAAITSSALLELQHFVQKDKKQTYLSYAKKIIKSLSEKARMDGRECPFILPCSVGSKPHHGEVGIPIIYADYYYIESLLRMNKIITPNQE